MKQEFYDWSTRTLDEKVNFPQEWWYEPDSDDARDDAKSEARTIVHDEDVVILGDGDADGLGAVAAIRDYYDEDVAFVSCGPHGSNMYLGDALWVCVDELKDGATVIIQDIAEDVQWKIKALPKVAEKAGEILWFDHHEWPDEIEAFVAEHVDHLEIDTGKDDKDAGKFNARCAAMMVRDYYESQGHTYSEQLTEAMDVTGEYDLWRLRDDRCFDLNDLTHVVDDHNEYIDLVLEHGANVLNDEDAADSIVEYRQEQTALHDWAVENANRYQVGDWTVATVYGNCPTNDVAETLREKELADVAAFVRPHGGISFRGSQKFEDCHTIAKTFDGGGHAQAAGARSFLSDSQREMLTHIATEGESVFNDILEEFETLAGEPAEPIPETPEVSAD